MKNRIMRTRSSMPPMEEYIGEIKEIWDTHWLTNMGVKHKEFQALLREYLGVSHVDLLTNGHMALELSLQAVAGAGRDAAGEGARTGGAGLTALAKM